MTVPSTQRVLLVDQMTAEWRSVGRSPTAVRALRNVARNDPDLARLVLGDRDSPASYRTPCELLEHMRSATGRTRREEAARVVRILLREAGDDPFIGRMLVQALLPGLVTVARRLRWGGGGPWQDREEFFGELVSTAWLVVRQWSGQDRPYAVLDLLSAIRCRARRQLFGTKDAERWSDTVDPVALPDRPARHASDLEELARILIELHRDGMPAEDVQVLYAHHVLGYTMAELASQAGLDRRSLYARRDRGQRRLRASV